MDISTEKYKSAGHQSNPFFAVLQAVQGLFSRLTGIFAITEEERLKAGIYLGGEGRE